MSDSPFLLLPPSEGKEPGAGPGKIRDAFGARLRDDREELRRALKSELKSMTQGRAEKLFKARGGLLEHAQSSMKEVVSGRAPVMPAWVRYSGVVWEHLDPWSLEDAQRARLLIPSGLYGVTTGTDAIADYRLTMLASLSPLGNLATWWRPRVTEALRTYLKSGTVIDLLPKEHAAAVDFDLLGESARVIRIRFVTADGKSAAGHGAKAVKGKLARRIVERGLARITVFAWEGWTVRREGTGFVVIAP
jgi:cytoplasmic iron level regulating protein YaaA (DUF328/UPF0246 family)